MSGTKNTIVKTYWFKWPDADTFKERLIELLACYPDRVIADEDEESCDAIWEAVTGVVREQKVLSARMIPSKVMAAFDAARCQRMACLGYAEHDSWRWGRVDGYACFVNNFAVGGVPNSVTEWSRDRLRQGHHYEGHINSINALRIDVIARIAKIVNPVLERTIAALIAPASMARAEQALAVEPHVTPLEPSAFAGHQVGACSSENERPIADVSALGATRTRNDLLTIEIQEILNSSPHATGSQVFAELKRGISREGSCVVDHNDSSVTYATRSGKHIVVGADAIDARIARLEAKKLR